MSSVSIEITNPPDEALQDVAKQLPEGLQRGVLLGAEVVAGEIRLAIRNKLRQHTGRLGRSFRATLRQPKRKGEVRAGAYSDLVYAGIQDEGGTVTASSARALTIPLSDRAKAASRAGRGARDFPKPLSLVWPRGATKGFLVEARRGRETIFHYLLKRSVQIPGVEYLDAAVEASEEQVAEILDAELSKSIEEAEG